MFGQTFYFSLIRKYVVLIGTLFNDIRITKENESGDETALIKVPVTYAAKDKMLARVLQDPNLDRQTATTTLPMISFEMGQMRYDGTRKLNTVGRSAISNSNTYMNYQYNPVPYNIEFKVSIYVKNTEDGTKIIEQILPFFTPDWTTTVKLIPEMEIVLDIPVILNDIKYEDKYDGDFKERRAIIWTLDLLLKGTLYGPVKKGGVIKFVEANFLIPANVDSTAVGNTPVSEYITIQPGLTANGTPTSNASLSIPYEEILATDDYGFITEITNVKPS
jgi:hypothetical protein